MKICEIELFGIEHVVGEKRAYGASRAMLSRRTRIRNSLEIGDRPRFPGAL